MNTHIRLKEYLAYLDIERGLALQTRKGYREHVLSLFAFLERLGVDTVEAVTTEHIRAFLAEKKTQNGNCVVTIARKIVSLRTFFKWLVDQDKLRSDPTKRIGNPKLPQRLPVFLEADEMSALIQATNTATWRDKRDKAIIVVLLMTGVRVSELCTLNRDDIRVQSTNGTENKTAIMRVHGKGDKERDIPVNATALEILQDYIKAQPVRLKIEALFVSQYGKRLGVRGVEFLVQKYVKRAGLKKAITPHNLRHTFATWSHWAAVDIVEISKLLGHENLTSTTIYTHTNTTELRKAVTKLETLYNGNIKSKEGD